MKIVLLGTGTSSGVPEIGCGCKVCSSPDRRDKRLRSSSLVEVDGLRILIDCGPDFRQEILPLPFHAIDAVLLTHEHYDHIGGLDDLRAFSRLSPLNIYGMERTLDAVRRQMPYAFADVKRERVPHLSLHKVCPGQPFVVKSPVQEAEVEVLPIAVNHGEMPIVGYRIGDFAYITDMKTMPGESYKQLAGVEFLVVNGLRFREHPTHQTVQEAVGLVRNLGIPRARIIHLAHAAGLHEESKSFLPSNISYGYDGEVIEI